MIDAIGPEQFRKKERAGIPQEVFERAGAVVSGISERGFEALREYSSKFDGFELNEGNFKVPPDEIRKAEGKLSEEQKKAIDEAFSRVYLVQKAI
ncbi:MAG TPA: hypothetical protein EYP90_02210, partial [Chromatiaceae bacterium]|nr:hypothetical protein [Chromatiaceae bacterium]